MKKQRNILLITIVIFVILGISACGNKTTEIKDVSSNIPESEVKENVVDSAETSNLETDNPENVTLNPGDWTKSSSIVIDAEEMAIFSATSDNLDEFRPIALSGRKEIEKGENYAFLCEVKKKNNYNPEDEVAEDNQESKDNFVMLFIMKKNNKYNYVNAVPIDLEAVDDFNADFLDFDELYAAAVSMPKETKYETIEDVVFEADENTYDWVKIYSIRDAEDMIGFGYNYDNVYGVGDIRMNVKKLSDGSVLEVCFDTVTLQKSKNKDNLDIPFGTYKDIKTYTTGDIEVTLYGNNGQYNYATREQNEYYYLIFGYINDYFDDYTVTVNKFIEKEREKGEAST